MINVLDKGYVRLVDQMGGDLSVVNSARASYEKQSTEMTERDEKLVNFLVKHDHVSTLRHSFVSFEFRAPLMVARQHYKHAIGSNFGEWTTGWNEACLPIDQLIRGWDRDYTVASLMNALIKGEDVLLKSVKGSIVVPNKVKNVYPQGVKRTVTVRDVNGQFFHATQDHKVLTNNGYKEVQHLGEDDKLVQVIDMSVVETDINTIAYKDEEYVYDIEMEAEPRNFIAGYTVVHNSRRYVTENEEFYLPQEWREAPESSKQGSGGAVEPMVGAEFTALLEEHVQEGTELYHRAMEAGIAAEQARLFLPAYGMYVSYYWSASLNSIVHFLKLRLAHDSQKEIQDYAQAVYELTAPLFPAVFDAFDI